MRWRRSVLFAAFALAAAFALLLPRLEVGFKVDSFFRSSDPELQQAMQHYGRAGFETPERMLLFAWSEPAPRSADSLARLQRFAAAAARHEVTANVISLAEARVPGALGSDPDAVAASSTWRHLLVGRHDDAVGGVLMLRPGYRSAELGLLCTDLRAAAQAEGRELNLCGIPYHNCESRKLVSADLATFLPIGASVSAVLLFWLVPHWVLALLALLVVPLTLVSTLGAMVLLRVEITMLTSTLPTLLLCMSVADGVHLVGRFLEERTTHSDPRIAAARTFALLFVPCMMTSLTTIVGFASLCTADLIDLRHLGGFAALGMAFAFLFAMTTLPAAMSYVGSAPGRRYADPAVGIVNVALACQRLAPRWWIGGGALVLAVSAVAVTGLVADHRMTADLWPDSDVMRQLQFYEERFVGIVPAEVLVETERGFGEPERQQLRRLCQRLEAEPGVSRTLSIADLYADGLSPLLVPTLAATGVLPAGMLTANGRVARVLVFRGDLGTTAWQAFAAAVRRCAHDLPDVRVRLAGLQMVGTAQVVRMTQDLAGSFAGSFVLIFVLVWLQCRSARLAAVAMVSCLLPMLGVLAWMAISGITLRPLTVIAFCVSLGLMIDVAIHLVARWQEERRLGRPGEQAVQVTLATAGRHVVITTLLLLVGFAVILGSEFRGTYTFGLLVDLSLSGALAVALLPLPALLRVLGRPKRQDTSGPP